MTAPVEDPDVAARPVLRVERPDGPAVSVQRVRRDPGPGHQLAHLARPGALDHHRTREQSRGLAQQPDGQADAVADREEGAEQREEHRVVTEEIDQEASLQDERRDSPAPRFSITVALRAAPSSRGAPRAAA